PGRRVLARSRFRRAPGSARSGGPAGWRVPAAPRGRAGRGDVRPPCHAARMNNARILADRLAGLLRREQAAMAEFLIALAEFDRHRCWVELGHSSLFYFLYRELGLSKGAAHYRKTAAELIQSYPEIVEPLRDGRLCITSIV